MEQRNVTWRRYAVKEQTTLPFDSAFESLKTLRAQRIMDNFADAAVPFLTATP